MERMLTVELEIAKRAERFKESGLTNLHQFMDVELLREVMSRGNKKSATGFDGQGWTNYCIEHQEDLYDLLAEFKTGQYKAPPLRRVYIPKDKDSQRPLGIPTIRDKILQGAVRSLIEPVYEKIFKDFSYAYRQGKTIHQALEYLFQQVSFGGMDYIIDADIQNFFGSIDHAHMREFLAHRVNDGIVRKTIDKWMKAGIFEDGEITYPEMGTPQGGSISPILSNIYLHYVLDEWFVEEIQPRLKGKSFMVRFADDFVMGFSDLEDAKKVMEVLPKRFGKFKLNLHPEKTKLLDMNSVPVRGNRSFDFLGFTHYMGKSLKGLPILKRKTSKKKFAKSMSKIAKWIKEHRHMKLNKLIVAVNIRLRGHYNFYGITFNSKGISKYFCEVSKLLFKWINRRGGKRKWNWDRYNMLIKQWIILLKPQIYHKFC
jgi:group II intron reverse transcriptase/maturase